MLLSDHVEALTVPDKEVDEAIAVALSIAPIFHNIGAFPHYPKFTASLDAAITLVPNGWLITDVSQRASCIHNWEWSVELGKLADGDWDFVRATAKKCPPNGFAIALTSAALRSRGL
jgi:hypothetical protein